LFVGCGLQVGQSERERRFGGGLLLLEGFAEALVGFVFVVF
jgi:hypothetical protein